MNRYAPVLRICPFVRMVAVCNNLALGKVDEKSDIDLFVVAKRNRLFVARTFLTLFLHLLGVRRHGKKVAGRFCLSFFVDDSFLNLSPIAIENDIYLAFWLKSMRPIVDEGIARRFLVENDWARRFFENDEEFAIDLGLVRIRKSLVKKFWEKLLGGVFGDFCESKLRGWQLFRAQEKAKLLPDTSGLLINEHILKFHNIDRRREYRNKWFKTYGADAKISCSRSV